MTNQLDIPKTLDALRFGELKYTQLTKRDLWSLLKATMENPALGLSDNGNEESFRVELDRVLGIMTSIDGVNYQKMIEAVSSKLTYDTLLILHQIMHNHVSILMGANSIAATFPGELESLGDQLKEVGDKVLAGETDVRDERITMSLLLSMQLLRLLNDLDVAANDLL